MFDAIIIGGGASGLACGIEAAKRGKQCLILEQKEKAGKKLYATGNGKCNFANRKVGPENYHSVENRSSKEIPAIITEELCKRTEAFFAEIGIPALERQGYLYPRSEQAAAVVSAMEQVFSQWKGRILCEEQVTNLQWDSTGSFVTVHTRSHMYKGRKLVLATGGMASPKLGSDGSGYALAKSLGHTITPCLPALCGLICKEKGWKCLQGVRAKGRVTIWENHNYLAEDIGEIQFTQYGVSGIVIFNLARYAAIGLYQKREISLTLDLLPDYSETEMEAVLKELQKSCGYRRIRNVLSGFLPEKLADFLIGHTGFSGDLLCSALTEVQLQHLITACKQMHIGITDTNAFEQAQVTAGGVPLSEIDSSTMESRLCSGCYLVGELLDVDAICGGYNLMWAWETGRRAGQVL